MDHCGNIFTSLVCRMAQHGNISENLVPLIVGTFCCCFFCFCYHYVILTQCSNVVQYCCYYYIASLYNIAIYQCSLYFCNQFLTMHYAMLLSCLSAGFCTLV